MQVSVVIAAKNEERYIEEAVLSVLNQENVDFELIVIDDNSSDATYEIVKKIADKNSRLSVYKNPSSGKNSAFNYGVSKARAKFVCIFAGDDIMPRGSLEQRFNVVQQFSERELVVGLCRLKSISEDKKFDGQVVPKDSNMGGFTGVSYLMSRAVLDIIFPVPEHLPNEDTWMEAAVKYYPNFKLVHSGVIGCEWRVHSGNSINMQVGFNEYNEKLTVRMSAFELFYNKYKEQLGENGCRLLQQRVNLENARRTGSIFRVLTTSAPLKEKLRALSATNTFFYEIRHRLYKLLSGL
ncbi:glycosyltransferase family 2 protein [Oligella urethralis]|uniref:Hyaluronan synthase n=1 Tax=Oligella urethralis TaxID=90245 RepID=A0A2N6Q9N6_9BURK|nr:glycosyltransferase family A protein [Oligella urethralis]PMC15696.1 glycosyltransferase family 2 protein [Oligella urethralis]SPY08743.1 Hyaluronan synthase [Oligella urethralis]